MIRFLALLLVLTGASAASAETITIGGVTRHYTARLPDTRPAPLVIVLHGNTQTGADMITRTAWPAVAKRENFAVVFQVAGAKGTAHVDAVQLVPEVPKSK